MINSLFKFSGGCVMGLLTVVVFLFLLPLLVPILLMIAAAGVIIKALFSPIETF